MTAHNPQNPLCDKNEYGDADGVRCTCDVDIPDEGNLRPSTLESADLGPMAARARLVVPFGGQQVTLQGRQAQTHLELVEATRVYDEAKQRLAPAEAAWRKALDAHLEALLGR